jgi:serine/threonine protein kinase
MFQLLKGVGYIHRKGYFHRDLKPENLVLRDNLLKITDFGIIKEQYPEYKGPCSEYIATRWYRAPEVVIKNPNYDSKIDIFAIGCIMAEMYTLVPLFPGHSELD